MSRADTPKSGIILSPEQERELRFFMRAREPHCVVCGFNESSCRCENRHHREEETE